MSKTEPKHTVAVRLEAAKEYDWYARGKRGAHQEHKITPQAFRSEKSDKVWLCNFKKTQTPPFYDGNHNH